MNPPNNHYPINYDINTPDGRVNAINWTNNTMAHIKQGGQWYVPRSDTTVIIRSHNPKRCRVIEGLYDPSLITVLKEAGWEIVTEADDVAEIAKAKEKT